MSNKIQYLLRSVQLISIILLAITCLFSSFSIDYPRTFVLSALTAFCISYKLRNFKLLAKCGFCFLMVALFVQFCTKHSSLFIWCVGIALILSSVYIIAERIKMWAIVRAICILLGGIWCFSQGTAIQQIRHTSSERKAVCLNRGSWGNVYDEGKGLTIKGQYSYNIFASLIGAKSITSLEELKDNNELWLVTPTQPFTEKEKTEILNWVRNGGFLFVISDHTNLFGHADVLNDLLTPLSIRVQDDCILDSSGDGGTYFAYFNKFKGLTANSFQGVGVPWLLQNGYSERADYGGHSFFSDNQISDEENSSIYTIGTLVPHGYGAVVLFGDSTLFSNFALSRPSAQALLKLMLNLGKPIPWFSLSAASLFYMLILFVRTESKSIFGRCILVWILTCTAFAISVVSILPQLTGKDFHLNFPDNSIKVTGDWNLAEGNGSDYTTLFAACYNQSCGLPEWCGKMQGSNVIVFSNGNTIVAHDLSAPRSFDIPNATVRLQNLPSMKCRDFMDCLVSDSKFSSFWFDDGIGPFKELAYTQFWQRLSDKKTNAAFPILGKTHSSSGIFTLRGYSSINIDAKITPIEGLAPWVILGDWVIAQEVHKGVFLIRSQWQHPSWGQADAVLRLSKCPPPATPPILRPFL